LSLLALLLFCSLTIPPPPTSTLFPYTTLFRSAMHESVLEQIAEETGAQVLYVEEVETVEGIPGTIMEIGQFIGETDQADELPDLDRKSTRLNSSHVSISYAVFCLKKKRQNRGA